MQRLVFTVQTGLFLTTQAIHQSSILRILEQTATVVVLQKIGLEQLGQRPMKTNSQLLTGEQRTRVDLLR